MELTNQCGVRGYKPKWLFHIHFMQNAIEEGIADIQPFDCSFVGESQGENDSNCDQFDDRGKGFMKVKTMKLMETLDHQPSFVLIHCSINIFSHTKYPLASNSFSVWREGNKGPSFILLEGSVFCLHCCKPIGIFQGLFCGLGFNSGQEN